MMHHQQSSDSEVIIAEESDGTRHKVILPPSVTARSIFPRRPKWDQHFSCLMFGVIGCGLLLLTIILIATSAETWFSSRDSDGSPDVLKIAPDGIDFEQHSDEDEAYHRGIVEEVNSKQSSWRAEYNKFASRVSSALLVYPDTQKTFWKQHSSEPEEVQNRKLLGDTIAHVKELEKLDIDIPQSFDARIHWPMCHTVHRVVNQGGCGSCYAMATTAVISDRICIKSNGTQQPIISAQDLISCCPDCGGCHGTLWALLSFNHWLTHGIVSGGAYGSYEGCKPYAQPPNCGWPCSTKTYASTNHEKMVCHRSCQNAFGESYEDDLYQGESVYWIKVSDANVASMPLLSHALNASKLSSNELIKREVMTNGPVLSCFIVYEEFQHYKSGIYASQTSESKDLYGHCGKLIGWGVDSITNKTYWTYMNTWSRAWGEDGFFRSFEDPEEVAAGIPMLH